MIIPKYVQVNEGPNCYYMEFISCVEEHAVCKWRQMPKDVKMEGDVAQAREPANETYESNPVR